MKGRSWYTFFQIAVYAFTPMVTLERIFLWNYHPYREAEGLARERVGHWTILRAVATPVPEGKSNPIHALSRNLKFTVPSKQYFTEQRHTKAKWQYISTVKANYTIVQNVGSHLVTKKILRKTW